MSNFIWILYFSACQEEGRGGEGGLVNLTGLTVAAAAVEAAAAAAGCEWEGGQADLGAGCVETVG